MKAETTQSDIHHYRAKPNSPSSAVLAPVFVDVNAVIVLDGSLVKDGGCKEVDRTIRLAEQSKPKRCSILTQSKRNYL